MPALPESSERNPAPRVLIVDDDLDILEMVRVYLNDHGYLVSTAPSASDALRQISLDPPDVLVLDLMMPGMSGTELMLRLRDMGLHLPTIIISGDAEAPRRLRGHSTAGLLTKPFALSELLNRIRRMAPQTAVSSATGEQQSGFRSPAEAGRTARG